MLDDDLRRHDNRRPDHNAIGADCANRAEVRVCDAVRIAAPRVRNQRMRVDDRSGSEKRRKNQQDGYSYQSHLCLRVHTKRPLQSEIPVASTVASDRRQHETVQNESTPALRWNFLGGSAL
jgi:hypothetical protein